MISIPDAASVRNVSAFDVHSLGASIAAVKPDTKIDCIGKSGSNLFCGIHQKRADPMVPVFFQDTKINQFRQPFSCKGAPVRIRVDADITGCLSLVFGGQCHGLTICLILKTHVIFFTGYMVALKLFFLCKNLRIIRDQRPDPDDTVIIINHNTPPCAFDNLILSYYCEFITEKSEKCVMIIINKEDKQKGGV